MKRCKSETTRAAGAVECTLLAEHEGAHEGQTKEDGKTFRVIWNDPNSPYREEIGNEEPTNPLPPPPPMPTIEEVPEPDAEPSYVPAPIVRRPANVATHCWCGTEHTANDLELRPLGPGLPLVAISLAHMEADERLSWCRVCINCGCVYCLIWKGEPIALAKVCTCPLSWPPTMGHAPGCVLRPEP